MTDPPRYSFLLDDISSTLLHVKDQLPSPKRDFSIPLRALERSNIINSWTRDTKVPDEHELFVVEPHN